MKGGLRGGRGREAREVGATEEEGRGERQIFHLKLYVTSTGVNRFPLNNVH